MNNGNKIKNFSAADIERYYKGLMTAGEMHALEKAALDDPFLADALEGLAMEGVNTAADISELNSRLEIRTGAGPKKGVYVRPAFRWMRVAALFVIIVGAGVLAYALLKKPANSDVAKLEKNKTEEKIEALAADTIINQDGSKNVKPDLQTQEETQEIEALPPQKITKQIQNAGREQETLQPGNAALRDDLAAKKNNVKAGADAVSASQSAAAKDDKVREVVASASRINNGKQKVSAVNEPDGINNVAGEKAIALDGKVAGVKIEPKERTVAPQVSSRDIQLQADSLMYRSGNIFRGRVTDSENKGIAFATVQITPAGKSIITNASGEFVITAPDTSLQVLLSAAGYNPANLELRNFNAGNRVILEKSSNNLSEVVVTGYNRQAKASRNISSAASGGPEPVSGWEEFYSYISKNIKKTDYKKAVGEQDTAYVELKFTINSKGRPVNISVLKSLCTPCDAEAIRLIKEGPAWNKKGKKDKATVKMFF